MSNDSEDGWGHHRMLVMDRLRNLGDQQKEMSQEIQVMGHDILALQYTAAMYGAIAGLIPAIIISVLMYLKFHNMLRGSEG
ncbi:MAG: hypothetical protein KAJ29_07760 [Alphaproteobacteria bacterium]|nr:hypothetical protein [Alphaproteobacteria bacterium]